MSIEISIDAIRAAFTPDATPESKAAGARACRDALAALEASAPSPAPPLNPAAIVSAITMLRGVPPDQLLDLAIAKLRAALPTGTEIAPVNGFKMPVVPFLDQGRR